jgi:hypothetical protein
MVLVQHLHDQLQWRIRNSHVSFQHFLYLLNLYSESFGVKNLSESVIKPHVHSKKQDAITQNIA